MKKIWKEETQIKIIFFVIILLLFVVLVPLFIMGHYNFQSVDDIGYAKSAEVVWDETHSVIKTFVRQLSYARDYWSQWQGTFAAEWFTTSMMGIFIKDAYYVGTYLSLGSFVLSELLLFILIFKRIMGTDICRAGIVSVCVICMQVLMTTAPVEAFYWFCGAVLYTVTYSEAFVLCALMILLYDSDGKGWKRALLSIGVFILTILVSGGTYVTLIGMLLCYLFAAAWFCYKKHPNRWIVLGGTFLYLAGFLLNVLAPGNQKRLSVVTEATNLSAIEAILASLKEAAEYVMKNTLISSVILGLLLLPLFTSIVKKKKFRFPLPLLVTLISFGVFAAQFTPTMYTIGIIGPGRIQNIYRWTLYIWLYGNELYWTGWILRKAGWLNKEQKNEEPLEKSYLLPGWIAGGMLLCFAMYIWGGDTLTTVSAVKSLRCGGAQSYYAEYKERLAVLEDDTVKDVVFESYSYFPYLLFFGDITENPEDWVNRSMAAYYNKDSVVIVNEN